MSDRQFYVYIHTKPDGTHFYVGKGTGRRATFFHGRSEYHQRIVAKYGRANIGVLTFNCESEQTAHAMEVEYIRQFREAGVELCNLCDGGEGLSGLRHTDESRKKIADANRNRQWSEERRAAYALSQIGNMHALGRQLSAETRKKISDSNKGKPKSDAHRAALSRARVGLPGRTLSQETRSKISAALKGVPKSATHREALSESLRKRK